MHEFKNLLNNKVIKASAWYTATEFFLKGIIFLSIPIFTRLLSPSDYGIVSLYTTWVDIFTVLIGLNLNTSITRGNYDFKKIMMHLFKYHVFICNNIWLI